MIGLKKIRKQMLKNIINFFIGKLDTIVSNNIINDYDSDFDIVDKCIGCR